MIYLASPYSHHDPEARIWRWRAVCFVAAKLMHEGKLLFSPISHTHPIAVAGELPRGWDYWSKYDLWYIERCTEVVVLKLPDWNRSTGVLAEIEIAKELSKPISFIEWDDDLCLKFITSKAHENLTNASA